MKISPKRDFEKSQNVQPWSGRQNKFENHLDNIMSGIDKETDQTLVTKRESQIQQFKDGDIFKYWDVHCLEKDRFNEPDCKSRYRYEFYNFNFFEVI